MPIRGASVLCANVLIILHRNIPIYSAPVNRKPCYSTVNVRDESYGVHRYFMFVKLQLWLYTRKVRRIPVLVQRWAQGPSRPKTGSSSAQESPALRNSGPSGRAVLHLRTLGSWVPIPLEAFISAFFCVLRYRPCDGPIPVQGVLPKYLKGLTVSEVNFESQQAGQSEQ